MTSDRHHRDLVEHLRRAQGALVEDRALVVGLAGAVGIGKSTLAGILAGHLAGLGLAVEVVATDGFILTNAELERLGLGMRKGFPETYDRDLLDEVLRRIHGGEEGVAIPLYSHETYDRLPGAGRVLRRADVVIVEGVNALQPPAVGWLDVAIYLEAEEGDLVRWFADRFVALCRAAALDDGGTSFYRSFAGMTVEEQRSLAVRIWDGVNGVNLRDHIGPSRARATHVVRKGGDHTVLAVVPVA